MNAESFIWQGFGVYFLLVGWGRLPLPRGGIADWFDVASQERFRLALGLLAPGLFWSASVLAFEFYDPNAEPANCSEPGEATPMSCWGPNSPVR